VSHNLQKQQQQHWLRWSETRKETATMVDGDKVMIDGFALCDFFGLFFYLAQMFVVLLLPLLLRG
jgi:hypothetical protein